MADTYNNQFKENEWANFLIPKIDLSRDKDYSISNILSSNIKKAPLVAVVNFLLKNFSEKYPNAVKGLGVKQNTTKVELAGQIINFVQLSQPQFCLVCKIDYLPFSQSDSIDGGSKVKCFVCKTPSHDTCVDETIISEDQGIVFLCNNCIQRKKAEDDVNKSPHNTPSKLPVQSDSSSGDPTSESSADESSVESVITGSQKKKKKSRRSVQNPPKTDKDKSPEKDAHSPKKNDVEIDTSKPKKDKICALLLEGKCPHGISGKACEYKHKRYCHRYCSFGDHKKHRAGCRFGEDCRYLHPKLCQNSVTMKACYNKSCTLTHLKFTKRKNESYKNHNNGPNQYNRPDTDRSHDRNYRSRYNQTDSKGDDKPNPWIENRSKQDSGETTKKNDDQHFLAGALERMQKELSNLITVQIQQQMQIQQQLQLQKFPQTLHPNLLLQSHPQISVAANQKLHNQPQQPTTPQLLQNQC